MPLCFIPLDHILFLGSPVELLTIHKSIFYSSQSGCSMLNFTNYHFSKRLIFTNTLFDESVISLINQMLLF